MTDITARNRAIKKTLEGRFGRGKIRVRGSRGTGYGWVHVRIDHAPLDGDESTALRGECKRLLRAARIDLGHSYLDDTCQHDSDQCLISFNSARYYRTMRHSDGSLSAMREIGGDWESV